MNSSLSNEITHLISKQAPKKKRYYIYIYIYIVTLSQHIHISVSMVSHSEQLSNKSFPWSSWCITLLRLTGKRLL